MSRLIALLLLLTLPISQCDAGLFKRRGAKQRDQQLLEKLELAPGRAFFRLPEHWHYLSLADEQLKSFSEEEREAMRQAHVLGAAIKPTALPSFTVTAVTTTLPQEDYAAFVQEQNEELCQFTLGNIRCHRLGIVTTQAGSAELLLSDIPTNAGMTKALQAILVHNGKGYQLTGVAPATDFSIHYSAFLHMIRSFTINH